MLKVELETFQVACTKGGEKSLHSYRVDGENIGGIYVFYVLQISPSEVYMANPDTFARAINTK